MVGMRCRRRAVTGAQGWDKTIERCSAMAPEAGVTRQNASRVWLHPGGITCA